MMPKAQLAASTLLNNNPSHPRKEKTYRVSYWVPDPTVARVPLVICEFKAWNRDKAIEQVKTKEPTAVIRACYRTYWNVMQAHNRGVNPITGELHRDRPFPRLNRLCKCGCGAACEKWQRFATSECRLRIKNANQKRTKQKRYRLAKRSGRRNPCRNCIKRDAEPGKLRCNFCRGGK